MTPAHEFRAVLGPDGIARVVYVPETQPNSGTIHASFFSHECEAAADAHNRERAEREALRAAGQGCLWP